MAGVAIEYVDGPLGLAIVLASFFINGFGVRPGSWDLISYTEFS
jgi:hypothetical protein